MDQSSLDPWIKELYIHSFTSFYGISIVWVGDFTFFFFQRHCHLEVKLESAGSFADLPSFDFYFFLLCKHSVLCSETYLHRDERVFTS